jgi:hypothetical protein
MKKILVCFFFLLGMFHLQAQQLVNSNEDSYLRNLLNELRIDTADVSRFSSLQEDSMIAKQGFFGLSSTQLSVFTKLAVRDFYLGRYDHVVVFAKEIKSTLNTQKALRNYLLLCSYAHLNNAIKFGNVYSQMNTRKDLDLMNAVRSHCTKYQLNVDKLIADYQSYSRRENRINLIGIGGGIVGIGAFTFGLAYLIYQLSKSNFI